MPNNLRQERKDKIRELFLNGASIWQCSKQVRVSRNTVRLLLRSEGLSAAPMGPTSNHHPKTRPEVFVTPPEPSMEPDITHVDFVFLEKLFELGSAQPETLKFKDQILALTKNIADELGVRGAADQARLQCCIEQMILYRRFYMMSLKASDQNYAGPLLKAHEKLARAVDQWTLASHRALESFLRLLRELEIRYGKRLPDFGRNNVFVNQSQIQVSPQRV